VPTRLVSVVLDCSDPLALSRWWARALGWTVTYESADEVEVAPADAPPEQLVLGFLPVRDPKSGTNQVHLDLASTSVGDQQRIVETLVAAGAKRVDLGQAADALFTVLADPEGNEFCVLEPREQNTGTGPIASIVLNSDDPAASGRFWAQASGWDVISSTEDYVGLRAPDGRGPFLDFNVSPGSGITPRPKDRLHLDVAPRAGEDQEAATAALVAAGARPVDVGQLAADGTRPDHVTWDVLVAPDGHEFCVLSPR
jgi:predicted enzyme related to lactoylglutathione lyase